MTARAIIRINAKGERTSRINYGRRMYAVIRRYTPEATEGTINECFAELTGLRSFFKMTYAEIATKIIDDIYKEIGIRCTLKVATLKQFEETSKNSKKSQHVSTYKEINKLLAGTFFFHTVKRNTTKIKKVRLTVPFLGKVK